MRFYDVSFVKNVLSSSGRAFKCVQDVVTVDADNPDDAMNAAKREFERKHSIRDWKLHADQSEITPRRRNERRRSVGRG